MKPAVSRAVELVEVDALPGTEKKLLVRLANTDLNNIVRAVRYQAHKPSEKPYTTTTERVYANELPAGVSVVKETKPFTGRRLSPEEKAQIIVDYTEGQIGVCQLARKYGCHHSTISKMLKVQGIR
jgi:hypothetical protein